jgi:GNAT superfamily N-acetyltransferase
LSSLLPTSTALEVFLRGFSATRSFTRPYLISELGDSLWMLADAPDEKKPARTPEVIAYGTECEQVIETLKQRALGRHRLCVLLDSAEQLQETTADYKLRGYRYLGREPFFVLDTARRKQHNAYPIRRILNAEEADKVAKAARSRQILPQHLTQGDSVCRLYAAFDGETPIGWARSIRTHPECAWVAGLFVHPDHRRKGIGRSLMSAMLNDDVRYGIRWSVLLASLTGAMLYPHLGYEECGLLLLFSPRRPR